jgi:tetratricopeptide (TPR) repeat protein
MSEGDRNLSERSDRGPMDQLSAHLDRGWDLVHRGDFSGAQRSAEKSLELDSESPEAHNLLGYAHAALGDHEAALDHYRHAIALDDSFVEAMLNAAEVLIHPLHDFQAAVGLVDDALEWAEGEEEIADALLLKFDAHMHQGDRESAKKVLLTLPEGEYETARLEFLVGRAHFEVGNLDQAGAHLERALKLEPDAPDPHYYAGLLYDGQGKHALATAEFLRCRALDVELARPQWSMPQPQFEVLVRRAIERLTDTERAVLAGALVVVCDLPGAEVVAEGVDPRSPMLLDAIGEVDGEMRAGRAFIYQRNVERMSEGPLELEDELVQLFQAEIADNLQSLADKSDTARHER